MKRMILLNITLFNFLFTDTYFGYLREIEASFCQSQCSEYMLESEGGEYVFSLTNLNNEFNLSLYINRYIEIESENEYQCIECSAMIIDSINLSTECEIPVSCFADPCEVAPECQLNTPVDCTSNYCGGCYADFYDLDDNLVDCYNHVNSCDDLVSINFGMCDMFLGYAVINGVCEGVSGCGWESDGIDYSDAFFNSFSECESNCIDEPYLCEDIEYDYDQLHSGQYAICEFDNDCIAVWGDCDVGLGGCHYSVNQEYYSEDEVDNLVDIWLDEDCMEWVCDCSTEPYAQCIDGICTSAYCMSPNPAGCFQTGCDDGLVCIDTSNNCTPSSCFCDGFYGDWFCTEDCGGGTCIILGDVNFDSTINIVDVVIIVNMILAGEYDSSGDINYDETLNVIDVILLVNSILD